MLLAVVVVAASDALLIPSLVGKKCSAARSVRVWSWSRLEEDENAESFVTALPKVPDELKAEVEIYLQDRSRRLQKERTLREALASKREEAMSNVFWRAGNFLFSLESFLPEVPDEPEREADALSYTELERFGYSQLIEPIMDAGGHVLVSRALGVDFTPLKTPEKRERQRMELMVEQRGLVLGSARDDMLASKIAEMNMTDIKQQAERAAKQIKNSQAPKAAERSSLRVRSRTPLPAVEEEEKRTEWPALLAPFSFGFAGRLYGVACLLCLAADPDATASLQAIDALSLDRSIFEIAHDLSYGLIAANLVAVGLCVARRKDANTVAKAAFAGPFVLLSSQ